MLIVAACLCSTVVNATPDLVGKVYDVKSQTLLYQEDHQFTDTSMQSTYTNPTGQVIGVRQVTFNQGRVTSYELRQDLASSSENVTRDDKSIRMQVNNGDQQQQTDIDISKLDEVVIDAGFSNFIMRNWDALLDDKKIVAHFASTAQLDLIKVQLTRVDPKKTSLAKVGDPSGIVMFQMQLSNPLIRWLISPIEVGYYQDSKQLAYYQGASNLNQESGEHYGDVRVFFDRQWPSDSTTTHQ
jgi:hypothetical protein